MQEWTVARLAEKFGLTVAAGKGGTEGRVTGGHCGDLLSEVMAGAPSGCIWLTVQSHQNTVAVAVLREMAAIVLTGGHTPDPETIRKADEESIPILLWPGSGYDLAGLLYTAGVRNPSRDD